MDGEENRTLETYSNSANLKAIPRQLKRIEMREQASQNLPRGISSLEPLAFQFLSNLESSSKASAMVDRGVEAKSLKLSATSSMAAMFSAHTTICTHSAKIQCLFSLPNNWESLQLKLRFSLRIPTWIGRNLFAQKEICFGKFYRLK